MTLDENGNAIQEADDFILTDGTNVFPITSGTSAITLTCPPRCSGVLIEAVSADIRVGKGVSGQYKTVQAQSWRIFPVTEGNQVIITRPSATVVEGFFLRRKA